MRNAERDSSLEIVLLQNAVHDSWALTAWRHEDVAQCSVCSECESASSENGVVTSKKTPE